MTRRTGCEPVPFDRFGRRRGTDLALTPWVVAARALRSSVVSAIVAFAVGARSGDASGGTSITFSVHADVAVRLQVARSPNGAQPCDSSDNEMVYDGMIDPREPLTLSVESGPICVQHTVDDFPGSNWDRSELWFRRPRFVRLEAHVTQS